MGGTPSLGPDAATYRGIEALRDATQSWIGKWNDYSFDVLRYADAGDEVVVLAQERGRGQTSDVSVEREVAQVHTFRSRKIVHTRLFGGWKEALEAAGLRE
jgi:ketosteroid isomerase-like protein